MLDVMVCDGKYHVKQDKQGCVTALRYGEPWRDCCGDNLVYWLATDLQEAQQEIATLKRLLEEEGK